MENIEAGIVRQALCKGNAARGRRNFFWNLNSYQMEIKNADTIFDCQLGLIALTRFI